MYIKLLILHLCSLSFLRKSVNLSYPILSCELKRLRLDPYLFSFHRITQFIPLPVAFPFVSKRSELIIYVKPEKIVSVNAKIYPYIFPESSSAVVSSPPSDDSDYPATFAVRAFKSTEVMNQPRVSLQETELTNYQNCFRETFVTFNEDVKSPFSDVYYCRSRKFFFTWCMRRMLMRILKRWLLL